MEASKWKRRYLIRVVVMPGEYLVKKLAESVPRSEEAIPFSEAHPSALPSAGQLFPVVPLSEEFSKGVLVYLEEVEGEEVLHISHASESLLEE
eukprot:5681404-Amphidinium_carterae.1